MSDIERHMVATHLAARPTLHREYLRKHTYGGLDALRGAAAVMVVFFHCNGIAGVPTPAGGYLAVDLFFMLSGFVLMHAYEVPLLAGTSASSFLRARIIRLYPLYLVGTVIGFALTMLVALLGRGVSTPQETALAGIAAVALLPSMPTDHWPWLFPLNRPSWSLLLEFLINLLFALVIRYLTMRLLCVLVAVAALALIASIAEWGSADLGSTWATLPAGLPRIVFSFFAGVLLYRVVGGKVPRTSNWGWLVPIGMVALLVVAPTRRADYDTMFTLVLCPLLIAAAATIQPPNGRVLRDLGIASYPLYVIHAPILDRVPGFFEALHLGRTWAIGATGMLTVVLWCAALALHHAFDVPVRRWLARALAGAKVVTR